MIEIKCSTSPEDYSILGNILGAWIDFIDYMLKGNLLDFFLGALSFIVPVLIVIAAIFYAGLYILAAFPWYVTVGIVVTLILLRFFWKIYKFNKEE